MGGIKAKQASKPKPATPAAPLPTFKDLLRQKLKPHNKTILAVSLLLDALVTVMALYSDNPPFNPLIYGAISAIVKGANLGLHYLKKIQLEDDDAG